MSGTLVSFEIGYLIGIVLFIVCERKGLILHWSRAAKRKMFWVTGRHAPMNSRA